MAATTELDSPWKNILEQYFEEFMYFFFPEVHALIDWKRGYEFLDKEFQKVVRDAKLGQRRADKLVKVWLLSGETAKLYIHVEVQGQFDRAFPKRMFVYHYRIFDCYEERIISLAILGDKNKEWRPESYSHEFGGCRLKFDFPVVKLTDYLDRWDELEQDPSPFSIVVRTHLKGIQTQKQPEERLRWKIRLFKALYKAQYARQDILNLVHFIDWVLALPKTLEQKFEQTITEYEEKKKVAYITSFERIGAKRGIKKGTKKGIKKGTKKGTKKGIKTGMLQKLQENVAEILSIRFKEIPEQLVKKIRSITDMAFLSELHRKAVLVESIPLFERIIEKHDEAAQDRQAA